MFYKLFQLLLCFLSLMCCVVHGADFNQVDLGRWSKAELEQIMESARLIDNPGDQIVALSNHFIDTPYAENTLIGDPHTKEQLVVNLARFDCFTFLDVIEALRRSPNVARLPIQLQDVRYRNAIVAYANRRHFFSDWVADEDSKINDVTTSVGQGRAKVVVKKLNLKTDGSCWVPEIPSVAREIIYIPTQSIDHDILSAIKAGDYVGVYSDLAGLDVSHTGLVVKNKNILMLRHASSRNNVRKVVDVELLEYLKGKPGLVVYRVKESGSLTE